MAYRCVPQTLRLTKEDATVHFMGFRCAILLKLKILDHLGSTILIFTLTWNEAGRKTHFRKWITHDICFRVTCLWDLIKNICKNVLSQPEDFLKCKKSVMHHIMHSATENLWALSYQHLLTFLNNMLSHGLSLGQQWVYLRFLESVVSAIGQSSLFLQKPPLLYQNLAIYTQS